MRRERGALQVWQCTTNGLGPAGLDRVAERPVWADEDAARDQQLGDVHVER